MSYNNFSRANKGGELDPLLLAAFLGYLWWTAVLI